MIVQDNWKEPVNEEAFTSLQKLCQFYELEERHATVWIEDILFFIFMPATEHCSYTAELDERKQCPGGISNNA